MPEQLRILYAVGPENVIESYDRWTHRQEERLQVSITYSSQFYEVCQDLNAKAYVIAQAKQNKLLRDDQFIVEHRSTPLRSASGLLYHIGFMGYGLQLLASAIAFRANVVIASSGTTHWFVWSILHWLGIRIIPSLHCVLWRKYVPQRLGEKLTLGLSRNFFSKDCTALLAVSQDIAEQVAQLTENQHCPIFNFVPTFCKSDFVGIREPDVTESPFRVLFAGRIERSKGVFDLLEIAKRFKLEGRHDIVFDVCGTGSALEALRDGAKEAGICDSFICHGYCEKPKMREMFNASHVFIVPTRTDFVEGFNRVVAEGILSGRPVVTSSVCPALSYVADAVVEVPPDDVQAYGDALLKLYHDRAFYEEKRKNCLNVQETLYDTSKRWGFLLKSVLEEIQKEGEAKLVVQKS
jgi:glycogen synthase